MALFETKTFSFLEMRMKMVLRLRRMTGKLRRHLLWHHHRRWKAHGHLNLTGSKPDLTWNPTSQMSPLNLLTAIKAALEDITFDQKIHYWGYLSAWELK